MRRRSSSTFIRSALLGAFAGGAALLVPLVLDVAGRLVRGRAAGHALDAVPLLVASGAVLGAPAAVLAFALSLTGRRPYSSAGQGPAIWARALLGALTGLLVASPLARAAFGAWASPLVVRMVAFSGFVLMVLATLLVSGFRSARAQAVLLAAGALALVVDGCMLVGTNGSLHRAVEAAALLAVFAGALRLVSGTARRRTRRAAETAGALALAWGVVALARAPARERQRVAVASLGQEPTPLGSLVGLASRALSARRVTTPTDDHAAASKWQRGESESDEERQALEALRVTCADCNVVVYFVDTLRADVARDPRVMPRASAFANESLSFRQAYSTASDTLRALPTLIGGRYDGTRGVDMLARVSAHGIDNALFISSSAHRFLEPQLPAFRFDEVHTAKDHEDAENVWGYGADCATGATSTRSFLEWARHREGHRFFAWIYDFDLHAWPQLRDDQLAVLGRRALEEARTTEGRYRIVARLVDRSFGILLDGLEGLGIAHRTIVVFVSDHGEALGYRGFDTHSGYLWEPLLRVPLALRVPGLEPRTIDAPVSIVDVAPTVIRYVDPQARNRRAHGLDLLRYHATPETSRSLPILVKATSEGRPSFVGLISDARKLVVPAGGGSMTLHDLDSHDPDDTDVASYEPATARALLDELERSPIAYEE